MVDLFCAAVMPCARIMELGAWLCVFVCMRVCVCECVPTAYNYIFTLFQ